MQYSFRQCVESDREWAYALKSEAYREVVERQFGPWNETFQRGLFAKRWNPGDSRVIMMGEKAIGLIAVKHREDQVWIDEIQLGAAWRNQGIGTEILRELISSARRENKGLGLQVLKQNTKAKSLYEKLGFVVCGESETHHIMKAP